MREIHFAKAEADALAASGFGKEGMKPAEAATRLSVLQEISVQRKARKKRLFWYRVVAWIVLILAWTFIQPRIEGVYNWYSLFAIVGAAYYIGKTDD
jgi:hypothetical protein